MYLGRETFEANINKDITQMRVHGRTAVHRLRNILHIVKGGTLPRPAPEATGIEYITQPGIEYAAWPPQEKQA